MKIIDISKTISENMVVYKNKESKKIKRNVVAVHKENNYHESRIEMDMHCGTHIDAPLHMIENGATVEQYLPEIFIGNCKVFDLCHVDEKIHVEDLLPLNIQENDIVLLKSKNSFATEYNPKFVYLEEDGANYLVQKKIKCLGMDAMSIERDKKDHPTHKIILGAGIGVIEDLQLKNVMPGEYFLSALPLKIESSEASPVRAVLLPKLDI